MTNLEDKDRYLEPYLRRTNLEIRGVPETKCENVLRDI